MEGRYFYDKKNRFAIIRKEIKNSRIFPGVLLL